MMSFGFLNLMMLAGLAGMAIPVLVHLISRRKHDVVHWGAMQFLELGRRTRRRIRIEEFLLLLLRMVLIALLAVALARPWAKGGLFRRLDSSVRRDMALVVDGSYSMGWEEQAVTPHEAAVQWGHRFLDGLRGGDSVVLLDGRAPVRTLVEPLTGDLDVARRQLDELPVPSGTSSVVASVTAAARLLSEGTNVEREIVLLTDGQALGWLQEDARAWAQCRELLQAGAFPTRLWAVDVGPRGVETPVNFMVERLKLTRELTVPGFPLRIETKVRQFGGQSTRRQVFLSVNGQRLAEKTQTVSLPRDGEAPVSFEYRFPQVGAYLVSVSLEPDNLPGDNQSDAAVQVQEGLPALLVDGRPGADPTQTAAFFAQSALSPSGSTASWVQTSVVDWRNWTAEQLTGQQVVILCDVPRLTDEQLRAVREFVQRGGGLVVAPGEQLDVAVGNEGLAGGADPLLPARFDSIQREGSGHPQDVNLVSDSLEVSWLRRFRTENGVDLMEARFARWWRLAPAETADSQAGITIAARLEGGDPFLIVRPCGQGTVAQLAVPFDSGWSTLPSRNDFVPLLHELVFHLASRRSAFNVAAGMPLICEITPADRAETLVFIDPDSRQHPAVEEPSSPLRVRLDHPELPGVYRCVRADRLLDPIGYFVVDFDRRESDLTPLSPEERETLKAEHEVRFVESLAAMQEELFRDESPTELWQYALLGVLALLVAEVLMTRRLVQGGHESVESLAGVEERSTA
jgi:hypothetical protein